MTKTLLAASLLSITLASGAAWAQATSGNPSTTNADNSPTYQGGGTPVDPNYGSPRGDNGMSNTSSADSSTSTSGTAAYTPSGRLSSSAPEQKPDLLRHNAAGGLPAGELSTPWQDTGGTAGSAMGWSGR